MTTLIDLCGQPLFHALGWTLLHFCWQGALVAVVLGCVLNLLGARPARARYAVACLALALMVALPLATFAHLASKEYRLRAAFDGTAIAIAPGMTLQVGAGDATATWPMQVAVALDRALPWLLLAWLAGVVLFVVRLNVGLMVARRMRSMGTGAVPTELQQAFDALLRRLGVARAVRLMHSALVQAPTVIGWLRPVILIPASCLTGMSALQIEAVLAHELAHIRRHDYLVSVLQSAIEALLFYHPAVWWVSKQVRRERECCCDELAVAVGGDLLAYARALSILEERRSFYPEVALGANGGILTMRIKRLLGYGGVSMASQWAAMAVLTVLIAGVGGCIVTMARAESGAGSGTASVASPMEQEPVTLSQNRAMAQASGGQGGDAATGQRLSAIDPAPSGTAKTGGQPDMSCTYYGGVPPYRGHGGTCEEDKAAAGRYSCRADDETRAVQSQIGCEWKVKRLQDWEHKNQDAQTNPNSEQFKKQMEDAQRQLQDAQINPNSPEFKKQTQDAQQRLRVVQTKLNNEQFKKQMEDAQRQLLDTQKKLNSPEFKKQLQDAQRQLQVVQTKLNGEQFKKQIVQLLAQNTMIAQKSVGPAPVVGASQIPHGSAQQLQVPAGVIAGNLISKVDPVYPAVAKAAHVQGTVVLHATISKTGTVEELEVVSGPEMLRTSAMDAVRQWTYKPYLMNGQPTEVETTITVNYTLPDSGTAVGPVPPADEAANGVKRVGGDVTAPKIISQPAPEFTELAKKDKVEGIVLIGLVVDEHGLPQHVHVLRGLGDGLDENAVDAVQQYKFKPATENGKPVAVFENVEVNFEIF